MTGISSSLLPDGAKEAHSTCKAGDSNSGQGDTDYTHPRYLGMTPVQGAQCSPQCRAQQRRTAGVHGAETAELRASEQRVSLPNQTN